MSTLEEGSLKNRTPLVPDSSTLVAPREINSWDSIGARPGMHVAKYSRRGPASDFSVSS